MTASPRDIAAVWNVFTGATAFLIDSPDEHLELARKRMAVAVDAIKHLRVIPDAHVDRLAAAAEAARGAGDRARSALYAELNSITDALVAELEPPRSPRWLRW